MPDRNEDTRSEYLGSGLVSESDKEPILRYLERKDAIRDAQNAAQAPMPDLHYWTCPNGHIVLDHYMPQSGTACNVSGCDSTRKRYTVKAARAIVALNDLIAMLFTDENDAAYTEPAIRGEKLIAEHCRMLAVRDRVIADA